MKVDLRKKTMILVLLNLIVLSCLMIGFANNIETVIYVDEVRATLTNPTYTISDEVMISIKDLSVILDEELYSHSDKSIHIGGVYIALEDNTFKNKSITSQSINEVTEKNGLIYVPLKAVSNVLICEVVTSNNKIMIKKLRPTETDNLKLIYDTRFPGEILSYEWIRNIDCSYNNDFIDIPIENIEVIVIKEVIGTEDQHIGLITSVGKWSNELYVNTNYDLYHLDESYRHIKLNEGKNVLLFRNRNVDVQSNMIYEIVNLPEFINMKDARSGIGKVMSEDTKIAFFMINGFDRETPQVLKIKSIKGYENIFIVVSTIDGQDIIIDNPENVNIKGILLSHSATSIKQLGEHRLVSYDATTPIFYMDKLNTLSSYHAKEIEPYLKGEESTKAPKYLYNMNKDIVNLFSRNIDSLSIEKENVASLGQYIDIGEAIESINAYYSKVADEYDAARQKYYTELKQKNDNQSNETFLKIPDTLKKGNNAFCGYYIENEEVVNIVELGEFSLNHHIKKNIPMKLPNVTSGILYFKGEMTFDKATSKLMNHGKRISGFEIYIDGVKTYDGNAEKERTTEFPEGTHLVEILYKSESEKKWIGYNIGISTPYEFRHYKFEVDLSEELSKGTQVYYIESMILDDNTDTTIDLKNYSGRIGLILKSGYYGNWKIINDDQVDITFVVLNNGLQSNVILEHNDSTKIVAISDENDEFIKTYNINTLKSELHYTSLDYIDSLEIYDKTKNKVEVFIDNEKVNFDNYDFPPILLKPLMGRKSVPMISLEVLADLIDCEYTHDEELGIIKFSNTYQKLIFNIESGIWEGNNGTLTSLTGSVEAFDEHYYVDLGRIIYELSYYLKWYVDEDRLMLTSEHLNQEKLDVSDSIPDNGFRVYEYNENNKENKYVKTYNIMDVKEIAGSVFLFRNPNMLLVQKVNSPEQQHYYVDIGDNILNESRVEVNGKDYSFKEDFILPKGEQFVYYYWYQKIPTILELKVK